MRKTKIDFAIEKLDQEIAVLQAQRTILLSVQGAKGAKKPSPNSRSGSKPKESKERPADTT